MFGKARPSNLLSERSIKAEHRIQKISNIANIYKNILKADVKIKFKVGVKMSFQAEFRKLIDIQY